jgi:pectinesterase
MTHGTASQVLTVAGALLAAGGCSGRSELLGSSDGPVDGGDASVVVGVSQTRIIVATDGTGDFRSVQAAVSSIAPGTTTPVEIDVRPGTYAEKVTVIDRPFISLVGADPLTTIIAYALDAADAGGTGKSAIVSIESSDFSAQNITFQNTTPISGAQAVALYANSVRQQFYNCRFLSYQDTIYVDSGSQYFKDCYVQGDDDYVLGSATAVFQDCTVYQAALGAAVVAPSTPSATPYGIVFLGGALTAAPGVEVGVVALGRPWGPFGSATYVGTSLGPHISAVGWIPMGTNDLTYARFAEYQTTGPGAGDSMRAGDSRQLTSTEAASLTLSNIFGAWTPSFSQ